MGTCGPNSEGKLANTINQWNTNLINLWISKIKEPNVVLAHPLPSRAAVTAKRGAIRDDLLSFDLFQG